MNNIGSEGCKHLSSAKWEHLTMLDLGITIMNLGDNNISDEGCKHLSHAKWDHINQLILCIIIIY